MSGRNSFSIMSVAFGLLGLALLPVMFPDLSLVCGLLAVALGLIGILRATSAGVARIVPVIGLLLGVILVTIAASSVVFGQAHVTGGGPAGGG